MELNLTGKVAVVTGGTAGIGAACVLALAREGCRVAVCARSGDKLAVLKRTMAEQGYDIFTAVADVANKQQLADFADQVVAQFGKLDIWVNNAGIVKSVKLIDMTEAEWDEIMNINLKSVFLGSQIAARHMRQSGGGVILNASSFATIIPSAGGGAYAASKAAISNLTRTLAAELAPYKIRVNGYIPGIIDTQMNAKRLAERGDITKAQIALNRVGEPHEVAAGIVFLASEAASYITGMDLEITGGKFAVQLPRDPWEW